MPAVSIVIPVHNSAAYLKDCLDSVSKQTLQNIEILCIENGSTDNSFSILKEYASADSRFRIFQNTVKSVCLARNKGIENANGEYLMFVDSDDFIHPQALEWMLKTIKEEQADIVQACSIRVQTNATFDNVSDRESDNFRKETEVDGIRRILTKAPCPFNLKHDAWVNAVKKLYRLETFKTLRFSAQLFHEDDADYSLFATLLSRKTVWIDKVLYYYRNNPNSLTKALNVERYCDSCANRIPLWHNRLIDNGLLEDSFVPLFIKRQTQDAYRMLVQKPLKRTKNIELLNKMSDRINLFQKQGMIDTAYLNPVKTAVLRLFCSKRFLISKILVKLGA